MFGQQDHFAKHFRVGPERPRFGPQTALGHPQMQRQIAGLDVVR